MTRIILYVVLPLIAGLGTAVNLVLFRLDHLMDPRLSDVTMRFWYGAWVVAALAVFFAIRGMEQGRWIRLVILLIVIIAAGFAPRIADLYIQSERIAVEQEEGATLELDFMTALADRSADIDDRIATNRKFTAEEGMDLLLFAGSADLSYRSLIDHTGEAFAEVDRALKAGILDPNAVITPPTPDAPALPLTIAFYEKEVKPGAPRAVDKHAWDLLQMLVMAGADISGPDAGPLRYDLAKTAVRGEGRFLSLQ